MRPSLKTLFLILVLSLSTITLWANTQDETHTERNYFQFVIPKYKTTRQSGQTVSIYVRYAYKPGLPTSQYFDYKIAREKLLKHMEPSDEFPMNTYWELLATAMGKDLMNEFPLSGVSIQLTVIDNQNPNSYEPGDHGPIYTIGDIAPLDIH